MTAINLITSNYVRGVGALGEVGRFAKRCGRHAFILGGKTALSVARDRILNSLTAAGVSITEELFQGEVSENRVSHYVQLVRAAGSDVIIGVGGGKAIDCSKWVADQCGLSFIAVPTSVATCASVVAFIVTYTDDSKPAGGRYSMIGPVSTIVDSTIICEAPTRLFAAGIADVMAKWPEFVFSGQNGDEGFLTKVTGQLSESAFALGLEKGIDAWESVGRKTPSPEVDELIDANLLIAGLSGNMSGRQRRMAVAHSIQDALLAEMPETAKMLHGERVAYGTLVQVALLDKNGTGELEKVWRLFTQMGLPTSFLSMGLAPSQENYLRIAEISCALRRKVGTALTTPEETVMQMRRVDELSRLSVARKA